MTIEWWTHSNLSMLYGWLCENGLEPYDGPAYFMEKPWNWSLEYDAFLVAVLGKAPLNRDPLEVIAYLHENGIEYKERG